MDSDSITPTEKLGMRSKIRAEEAARNLGNVNSMSRGQKAGLDRRAHGVFFHRALDQSHALGRKQGVGHSWLCGFAATHSEEFGSHCVERRVGTTQYHQKILLGNRAIGGVDQGPPAPHRFLYFGFALFSHHEGINLRKGQP